MVADRDGPRTRRSLLLSAGALGSVSVAGHVRSSVEDSVGDGIPDQRKRSASFNRELESIFGGQFEALAVDRADLLLDVRYVGDVDLHESTKRAVVDRFRARDVHAQWLDYPVRYDLKAVLDEYGGTVKDLLWGPRSFYAEQVESSLKDVALQLFVVPGATAPAYEGRIYSHWMDVTGDGTDGYVNGFSVGNRAVVAERDDPLEELRLTFHEIAHLALCHDDDPDNAGVMGTGDEVALTEPEWSRLRDGLDNVRDDTGLDIAFRPCLWTENLSAVLD